jgi:hypothetical protein
MAMKKPEMMTIGPPEPAFAFSGESLACSLIFFQVV